MGSTARRPPVPLLSMLPETFASTPTKSPTTTLIWPLRNPIPTTCGTRTRPWVANAILSTTALTVRSRSASTVSIPCSTTQMMAAFTRPPSFTSATRIEKETLVEHSTSSSSTCLARNTAPRPLMQVPQPRLPSRFRLPSKPFPTASSPAPTPMLLLRTVLVPQPIRPRLALSVLVKLELLAVSAWAHRVVVLEPLMPLRMALNSPSLSPPTLAFSELSNSTLDRSRIPARPITGLPTLVKASSAPATPPTSVASRTSTMAPNCCTLITTGEPLYPSKPSLRSAARKPSSLLSPPKWSHSTTPSLAPPSPPCSLTPRSQALLWPLLVLLSPRVVLVK